MNWHRAQYAAARDEAALLKGLRLAGRYTGVKLPGALPPLGDQAMSESQFSTRLQQVQTQVQALRRDRHAAAARLAYQAHTGSHAVATITLHQVLKLREWITDETQLHYNGMLKSTWDLLAEVQNQAQARADLINAQRDAAVASVDLQWALFGGEPDGLPALGGSSAEASPKAH